MKILPLVKVGWGWNLASTDKKTKQAQGKVKKVEEKITKLVGKPDKHSAELKWILAKSIPSWMSCKLDSASQPYSAFDGSWARE